MHKHLAVLTPLRVVVAITPLNIKLLVYWKIGQLLTAVSFVTTVQGRFRRLRAKERQPGYNNVTERHSSCGSSYQEIRCGSWPLRIFTDVQPQGPFISVVSPAMEEHMMTTVPKNAKTGRCVCIDLYRILFGPPLPSGGCRPATGESVLQRYRISLDWRDTGSRVEG